MKVVGHGVGGAGRKYNFMISKMQMAMRELLGPEGLEHCNSQE